MSTHGFFITGTDTGTGKTTISCALLHAAAELGLSTVAMKPVSAGCRILPAGKFNDDALMLQQCMNTDIDYGLINPYALTAPVSPHLAAQKDGVEIDLEWIATLHRRLSQQADFHIVEGIGGWLTPLSADHTVADMARRLALPVILVVSIRLGCLSQALLTYESITARHLTIAGWVANICNDGELYIDENILTLAQRLPAPCVGRLPYSRNADARQLAGHLDLDKLL